jgi:hypothetical protein
MKQVIVAALLSCALIGCGSAPTEESRSIEAPAVLEQGVFTKSFGVHSTESYQNTWLANLTGADTAMSRMIGVLDDAANSNFWYDLDGKQYY